MDIYSFFNSRDIAAHCQDIGKTWTTFEMAVIIGRSKRPIREKHAAWRELISDYPDMPTPGNNLHNSYDSIHGKLTELIAYEEHLIEIFQMPEAGAVYICKLLVMGDDEDYDSCGVFSSLDKGLKYMQNIFYREDIEHFRIDKVFLEDQLYLTFELDYDGNPLDLPPKELVPDVDEETLLDLGFDFFIDIPVPFKKGDILFDGKPFVLDSLISDNQEVMNGFDIGGNVFYINLDKLPGLFSTRLVNYDCLEYYRGKLEGADRLLQYVSRHLHGEISDTDLLTMQNKIMLEHLLDNVGCSTISCLSDDDLNLHVHTECEKLQP